MLKLAAVGAAILCLAASPALAQVGNAAMPIMLKMKRGTDSLTVTGRLTRGGACCTYTFKAGKGQTLHWSESGAAARLVITDPDGTVDGPGFANPLPLPATGTYTLAVSPNLMADGAYGRFTLKLRIPPLKR